MFVRWARKTRIYSDYKTRREECADCGERETEIWKKLLANFHILHIVRRSKRIARKKKQRDNYAENLKSIRSTLNSILTLSLRSAKTFARHLFRETFAQERVPNRTLSNTLYVILYNSRTVTKTAPPILFVHHIPKIVYNSRTYIQFITLRNDLLPINYDSPLHKHVVTRYTIGVSSCSYRIILRTDPSYS